MSDVKAVKRSANNGTSADGIKVRRRKLSDYKQLQHNANKGTVRGLAMHEQSVDQFGAARSAVADVNDVFLAGNHTAERLYAAGIDDVIEIETDGKQFVVVKRPDLDANTERGKTYSLLDNRVGELNLDWSSDVLQALAGEGVDLAPFFDDDELAALLADVAGEPPADPGAQVDKAEELQAKWQVLKGDLWTVGNHRLLCGDSTRREDVVRVMGGEKADMVFTDPPYNVASEGRNYAATAPNQKKTYEALKNAEWDKNFDVRPALDAMLPALAENCAVYVCTSQFLIQKIWDWATEWSDYNNYCVWCKPNPAPSLAERHWTWATELLVYAVRGKHVFNFPPTGHALNWWEIVSPTHSTGHPTEKPLEVPTHAIEHSSKTGAIVLDSFIGSGTTLVACEQTGRKGRGIEIEPKYVAVTLERLAAMGLQAQRERA